MFGRYNLTLQLTRFLAVVFAYGALLWQTPAPPPIVRPDRGFYPTGVYSASDIESINNVNGSLTLRIPLASLPPGRAGFKADLGLAYSSQMFDVQAQRRPFCEGQTCTNAI